MVDLDEAIYPAGSGWAEYANTPTIQPHVWRSSLIGRVYYSDAVRPRYHFTSRCEAITRTDRPVKACDLRRTDDGRIVLVRGDRVSENPVACTICNPWPEGATELRFMLIRKGECHSPGVDMSDKLLASPFATYETKAAREGAKVCTDCPVKAECIDYADLLREQYGTFGGETQWKRRERWKGEG